MRSWLLVLGATLTVYFLIVSLSFIRITSSPRGFIGSGSTDYVAAPLHFLWGFWDATPFPVSEKADSLTSRGIASSWRVHGPHDIPRLLRRYSTEVDGGRLEGVYWQIPRPVCRSDIARLLVVYFMGGLYLDVDASIRRKITRREWNRGIWILEKIEAEDTAFGPREEHRHMRVANYAFGAPAPGCPAVRACLEEATRRISLMMSALDEWSDSDVLWVTGPDVQSTLYAHRPQLFGEPLSDLVEHAAMGAWRSNP